MPAATATRANTNVGATSFDVDIQPEWMASPTNQRALAQALENIRRLPSVHRLEVVPIGAVGPAAEILHKAIAWPMRSSDTDEQVSDATGFKVCCRDNAADVTLSVHQALDALQEEIENSAATRGHVLIVETPAAWRTTRIGKKSTAPDIYSEVAAKIAQAQGVGSLKHMDSKDAYCTESCMMVIVPEEGADILGVRKSVALAMRGALAAHQMSGDKVAVSGDPSWIFAGSARVYAADLKARAGDVLLESSRALSNSFLSVADMRIQTPSHEQSAHITAFALDDFSQRARQVGLRAQIAVATAGHKSVILCQLNGDDAAQVSTLFRQALHNAANVNTNGSYLDLRTETLREDAALSDYTLMR
jgi:hypothetical protein